MSTITREGYKSILVKLWTEKSRCPFCGTDQWNIGDEVESPLRHKRGQAYVYSPITCLNCGYTAFFHTGIVSLRAEEA